MKRLISVALAVIMAISLSMTSFASELISITIEGEDPETGCFVPGKTYYLEAMDGSYHLDSDFFSTFRTKIEVNDEAKKYVLNPRFQKMSDGYYRLAFTINPNYSYKDNIDVNMIIYATDKKDRDNTYETYLDFQIGYGGSEICYDEYYSVEPGKGLIEFDTYLKGKSVTLEFDGESTFQFKCGSARMMNFSYSTEDVIEIYEKNSTADLTFLNFYGRPQVVESATLRLYSPYAKYLYEIGQDNNLTRIIAPRHDDYFVVSTNRLGNYVASDIALKSIDTIVAGAVEDNSSSNNEDEYYYSSSNNNTSSSKPNPSTGAEF